MLQRIFFPKENCVKITQLFVSELGVKVSPSTIEKELTDHPDYPSLLSISDVLDNYGIENVAFKSIPSSNPIIVDQVCQHNFAAAVNVTVP